MALEARPQEVPTTRPARSAERPRPAPLAAEEPIAPPPPAEETPTKDAALLAFWFLGPLALVILYGLFLQ